MRDRRPARLSQKIGSRILLFAALAMVVQVVVVLANYYFDDAQLAALMVEREAGILAKGLSVRSGTIAYDVARIPKRYAGPGNAYFARVRTPEGAIIYSNCDARCGSHLLPQEVNPPDLWSRLLRPGKPIAVEGGRSYEVSGKKVFIEVALLDDHEQVMAHVLGRELADHLAAPMSLMLLFILGGMLLSVRLALRPVERAAQAAEGLDPLDPAHQIDIADMPLEIAELASAVNRMLTRIGSLMQAQRVYATAIAHEVRTPLAMIKLELGNIDHPRARKVEADLDALARFVGQITDLGRLEATDRTNFGAVDLAALARSVVQGVAPWVYDHGGSISFDDLGSDGVEGQASLIESAIRNLVENAIRHTPPGTGIQVVAGPGRRIVVADDAGSLDAAALEASLERPPHTTGVGLQIVRRIMVLHRGTLSVSVEPGRRTTTGLDFTGIEPDAGQAAGTALAGGRAPLPEELSAAPGDTEENQRGRHAKA